MPVRKNLDMGKWETYCDYCGEFCMFVNQEWLQYAGYTDGKIKFDIRCDLCNQYEFKMGHHLNPIVKGYGRLPIEMILKFQERNNMSDAKTKRTTKTNDVLAGSIQWESMDKLIDVGNCRLSLIAEELNANVVDLREQFIAHYGDKIVFKRGRNGGVFWSNQVTDTTVAPTTKESDENN